LLLVADLGAALGALVQVEGVLCQAQLAEGVFAGGGHRMGEVVFAEQAKDGDAVEAGGVGGLLFLYLLGDDVELLLLFSLGLFLGLYLFRHAIMIIKAPTQSTISLLPATRATAFLVGYPPIPPKWLLSCFPLPRLCNLVAEVVIDKK
jgi:hypothetical protein